MPFSEHEAGPGWDPFPVQYRFLASPGLHSRKTISPLASSQNLPARGANKSPRPQPVHPRIFRLSPPLATGLLLVGGDPAGVPGLMAVFQSRQAYWNTVII